MTTNDKTYRDGQESVRLQMAEQWLVMRDWKDYETRIGVFSSFTDKVRYLRPTAGMEKDMLDSSLVIREAAAKIYDEYHRRAIISCKGFFRNAVSAAKNTIHRESASYVLPEDFNYFVESATDRGETLNELHQEITSKQCVFSRCGVLLEVSVTSSGVQFFTALYDPERIMYSKEVTSKTTRKKVLSYVVLDITPEGTSEADLYMILGMQGGRYFQKQVSQEPIYDSYDPEFEELNQGDAEGVGGDFISYNGKYMDYIPFQIICADDLKWTYKQPKFSASAYADWAMLMANADYKQHMHESSQGIWLFAGFENYANVRSGAGGGAFTDRNPSEVDIKHIGVDVLGLEAQRVAINDITESAASENISNMKQVSGESGVARVTILEARTLPLVDMALTSSAGITNILHFMADWAGRNREDFYVEPNLNFFPREIDSSLIKELVAAKANGALITDEMILKKLQDAGLTDKQAEEIRDIIATENPIITEEIKIPAEV